jgi:alpha-glucosidase
MRNHFESIGTAKQLARTATGISLKTPTEDLQVTVLAENVVRVTMRKQAQSGAELPSCAVIRHEWPGVSVEIKESPTDISLITTKLHVRISKSPIRVGFYRPDGTLICPDTPNSGMGWTEDGAACFKTLPAGTRFYGFGERTGYLDKRGTAMTLWNTDTTLHTPSTDSLYVSIPFFIGFNQGHAYGLFLDSPGKCTFDMGKTSPDEYMFATAGEKLDYYFFAGPEIKDVVQQYAGLTGTMELPPLWALGYHQSRYSYCPQDDVEEVARNFREHDIPCDVIYLDIHYMDGYRVFTFDQDTFPDPSGLIDHLTDMGFKVVTIIDPGVKIDPKYKVYKDGLKKDCFVRLPTGKLFEAEVWPGRVVFPDFLKEKVRTWWASNHKTLFRAGVRGIWNDMNEPSCFDTASKTMDLNALHGEPGMEVKHAAVHNAYANFMNEATHEAFRTLLPGTRPFVITRAGYSGIQRLACVWTGDNASWWEHLLLSIPMCLNLGLSGIPFVGADAGGFQFDTDPELLTRWTQLGTFIPFFRNHSAVDTCRQEPYLLDDPYKSICRGFIKLRYRLIPYIYTMMHEAATSGTPIMRPLVLEFPEDPKTHGIFDQFMLGPSIMVAPVYQPETKCRQVYLPKGEWLDLYTHKVIAGNRYVLGDAPLEKIPVFLREGAIIPMGREMHFVGEQEQTLGIIDICPSRNARSGKFSLYVDDGETEQYRAGHFGFIHISYAATQDGRFSELRISVDTETQNNNYCASLLVGTIRIWDFTQPPVKVSVNGIGVRPVEGKLEHAIRELKKRQGYYLDRNTNQLYVGVHGSSDDVEIEVVWMD